MTSANSSARLRGCFYTTRHNWDSTFTGCFQRWCKLQEGLSSMDGFSFANPRKLVRRWLTDSNGNYGQNEKLLSLA
jgi:hypothetical protein